MLPTRYRLCSPFLATGLVLAAAVVCLKADAGAADRAVDFNRDIRPILSDNCFACHGPDENTRKSGFRLDLREEAFQALDDGRHAIVPGDAANSELVRRITADDPDDRMPPARSTKQLGAEQIGLLRRWIEEGALWEGHWAYQTPARPKPPRVRNQVWIRNAIDRFVLAGLEREGVSPAREADKEKLIRRVTLDLTGLPPTPAEVEAFLEDQRPNAYEVLVDRLLASPAYGEHMAMFWLDLARYADTNGYHIDNHRDIWLWRQWVIDAFNRNQPFDQFTIEQLAGDLLPDPTPEQRIATGFNRNEMVNFEGGADPNEYAVKYVVGRVDTTSRVFLGTTMACAECHDHKYDPITIREYYKFFAFFNTVAEKGLDGNVQSPAPIMKVPSPDQASRLEQFDHALATLEARRKTLREQPHEEWDRDQAGWEQALRGEVISNWTPVDPSRFSSEAGAAGSTQEMHSLLVTGTLPDQDHYDITIDTDLEEVTGIRLEALPHETLPGGAPGRGEDGRFVLTGFKAEAVSTAPEALQTLDAPELGNWWSIGPFHADDMKQAFQKVFPPEQEIDLSKSYQEGELQWLEQPDWKDGTPHELKGENAATYLHRTLTVEQPRQVLVSLGSDDGIQVWLNGDKVLSRDVARGVAPDQEKLPLRLSAGENRLLMKINNGAGGYAFYFKLLDAALAEYPVEFATAVADAERKDFEAARAIDDKPETGWSVALNEDSPAGAQAWFIAQQPFGFSGGTRIRLRLSFESDQPGAALGHFRVALSASDRLPEFAGLPASARNTLLRNPDEVSDAQRMELRTFYRNTFVAAVREHNQRVDSEREARKQFHDAIPVTMVMEEMEQPRDTHLLVRGDWQTKGGTVTPDVPSVWPGLPSDGPANRLALARWLVDPNHPLTSRVTVNRFWMQYFGHGIVRTPDDFGAQGEWPTHPELLNWLAVEFVESGWDIKALQRLLVLSATYRQSSDVEPGLLDRDPDNRLYARGPRFRLPAETIRDQALAVSGLLHREVGGPSARPFQPPGLWEAIGFTDNGNFSSQSYEQSEGVGNYRRGLYVYWKRSMPYASFVAFDAPNREVCTIKRPRTNTPLQALVLLNDPVYVEAARALGHRILKEAGRSAEERLVFAFNLCLARDPRPDELAVLERVHRLQQEEFRAHPDSARELIQVGYSDPPEDCDAEELAVWTAIGNVLLNLDEMVTKG